MKKKPRRPVRKLRVDPFAGGYRTWYRQHDQRADQRGIPFTLTLVEFSQITRRPCAFCGTSPEPRSKVKAHGYPARLSGIRRLDASRGFVPGNCAGACKRCAWGSFSR